MNRTTSTALAVATAAAAAAIAIASGDAFADDITIDNTPFVSTLSRAEVRSELLKQPDHWRHASDEWTSQLNGVPQLNGTSTVAKGQARSDYKTNRLEVNALNGEDSGSFHLARTRGAANGTSVMGGPAR